MLSAIGFFVVLSTAILLYRVRVPRHAHETKLGRMSTQWIAKNRIPTIGE